jgi:glutathione S-transferase
MKLHTFIGSPNGRKVEAVIHHLNLQVEREYHNPFSGELREPAYLSLNPNGMLPTLVDGSFALWESNAIMQYLADGPDDALFPRDRAERADIVRWLCWELAHFNKAFGALAFETVAKLANQLGPADEAVVRLAAADLMRYAPALERYLAGRTFLVGNRLSIADYAVITFESYRSRVPFDWRPFPRINEYFDRIRSEDAWTKASAPPAQARAA